MLEQEIPLAEIYSDSEFNCRGHITPQSVQQLSKEIAKDGLLYAIIVQPFDSPKYKYKIVAGHRRFLACKLLKWQTITCKVRINLTEDDARRINYIENMHRLDLNILQQAQGMRHYKDKGMSIEQIAKELVQPRQWVDVRLKLLDLEEDIQVQAAAGLLTQQQILDLWRLPKAKRIEASKIIKEAKLRGDKAAEIVKKKKTINPTQMKRRNETEIMFMVTHILEQYGECLATRTLAWANGNISDYDLFLDIKKGCEKEGKLYSIPVEYKGYCIV